MGIPQPLFEPWALSEAGLQLVLAVASRDEFFAEVRQEALKARDGKKLENTLGTEVRSGVALIPISGPLFRHADVFAEISGATSYATIRKDFETALNDPTVRSIVLDIDSPGGEVHGVAELANAIYDARGRKPITAYVGGQGASAAYWLASAADEIVAAETAELGSIGVRVAIIDDSEQQKKDGRRRIEFVSSQSPFKRMDPKEESDRARLQVRADELADLFISAVARNRGTTSEVVAKMYGEGDTLIGARAVQAGLADKLGSLEGVIAQLSDRSSAKGHTTMNVKAMAKLVGLDENATEKQVEERAEALAQFERDTLAAAGTDSADQALGKVRAGIEAIAERDNLRAQLEERETAQLGRDFRQVLEQGVAAKRLTLGHLAKTVPTLLKEEEATVARAALASVKEQTATALIDALCTAKASPKALTRVRAFIEAQTPLPSTVSEPAPTKDGKGRVLRISDEQAAAFGTSQETIERYSNVNSAADLKRKKKEAR